MAFQVVKLDKKIKKAPFDDSFTVALSGSELETEKDLFRLLGEGFKCEQKDWDFQLLSSHLNPSPKSRKRSFSVSNWDYFIDWFDEQSGYSPKVYKLYIFKIKECPFHYELLNTMTSIVDTLKSRWNGTESTFTFYYN